MKQYKNYIFSVFFCICSLFSVSFFSASYTTKAEFGVSPDSNVVLLSSKDNPISHYVVLNELKPSISILENSLPDVLMDFPRIEEYFIRFWEMTKVPFQKPTKQTETYTILSRFPRRILRI